MKRVYALLLACLLCLVSCGEQREEAPGEEPERLLRRWHGEFTDHLIPSEDYGTLYRFYTRDPRFPEEWALLYGLMTQDGTVVLDAVYPWIGDLTYAPLSYGESYQLPVYMLQLTDDNSPWDEPEDSFTVMARDGRWVIEGSYAAYGVVDTDAFLLKDREGNCKLFDTRGTLLNEFSGEGLDLPLLTDGWRKGFCVVSGGEESACALFDARTGEVTPLPGVSGTGWLSDDMLAIQDAGSGLWGYLDTGEDQSQGVRWVIPPLYSEADIFRYGTAKVRIADNAREAQIDREGHILTQYKDPDAYGWYIGPVTVNGKTLHWVQENRGGVTEREAVYDENWNLLGELPEGVEAFYNGGRDPLLHMPDGSWRWAEEGKPLDPPDYCRREDCVIYPTDGLLKVILGDPYESYTIAILSQDGTEIIPPEMYGEIELLKGEETGRSRFLGIPPWGSGATQCRVHDEEGKVVFSFESDPEYRQIWCHPQMLVVPAEQETLVYNLEGEVLLRYTLFEEEA